MRIVILALVFMEFIWVGLRPVAYILVDLIPVRIFGLPLITISLFHAFSLMLVVLITSNKAQKSKVSVEIALLGLVMVVAGFSTFLNPVRDVLNESKGLIIFLSSIITFRLILIRDILTEQAGIRLLHLSLTIIYSWLMFRLMNDPLSLPMGYSDGYGLRFEGLYSSAPLPLLVVSGLYLFKYSDWAPRYYKVFAVYSLLIAILALILSGTRSTMIVCLLSALFYLKLKGSLVPLGAMLAVGLFLLGDFTYWDIVLERFNDLKRGSLGSDRIFEMQKEIELFIENPLGRGFGILNKFTIPNFGKPLFGHNIFTSLLVRHGVLGISIFFAYLRYVLWLIGRSDSRRNGSYVILSGILLLCSVSNFSTYLLFGTYGIYFGLVLGCEHGNITSYRPF